MKTIKIFCLPSHATKERVSGVDFARIIQPMSHLNGYSDGEVNFKVDIYDPKKEEMDSSPLQWLTVAKNYDIIYFNYLNNPWGFAAMGGMARGYDRKLVMDMDDSLWDIRPDNSAYSVYNKDGQPIRDFTSICNEVDYITTTNSYLKHVIMNRTTKGAEDIKVFPNYVDLDLYSHRSSFKDDGRIRLLHYGSTTHFVDLQEQEFMKGVDRVLKEYPNATIKFIGAFIPQYRNKWGLRYENAYGHEDLYKWVEGRFREYMDESDMLVCPLSDDIYNRSKSSIKFIETSSTKKPGIYQRIRQYEEVIRDYENGILASKSPEWYEGIKYLIDNPDKRKEMGEQAYEDVKNGWTMQAHVTDYANFFKSILVS